MTTLTKWLSVVNTLAIVLILATGGYTPSTGAAGDINTNPVWFVKGLTAGNPKVTVVNSSGSVVAPVAAVGSITSTGDGTIGGGTLTVTNTANASSTLAVGCVQTNATSSATSIQLIFNTVATSTGNGYALWKYGTCPNL